MSVRYVRVAMKPPLGRNNGWRNHAIQQIQVWGKIDLRSFSNELPSFLNSIKSADIGLRSLINVKPEFPEFLTNVQKHSFHATNGIWDVLLRFLTRDDLAQLARVDRTMLQYCSSLWAKVYPKVSVDWARHSDASVTIFQDYHTYSNEGLVGTFGGGQFSLCEDCMVEAGGQFDAPHSDPLNVIRFEERSGGGGAFWSSRNLEDRWRYEEEATFFNHSVSIDPNHTTSLPGANWSGRGRSKISAVASAAATVASSAATALRSSLNVAAARAVRRGRAILNDSSCMPRSSTTEHNVAQIGYSPPGQSPPIPHQVDVHSPSSTRGRPRTGEQQFPVQQCVCSCSHQETEPTLCLRVDLGAVRPVSMIQLFWGSERLHGSSPPRSFDVYVSSSEPAPLFVKSQFAAIDTTGLEQQSAPCPSPPGAACVATPAANPPGASESQYSPGSDYEQTWITPASDSVSKRVSLVPPPVVLPCRSSSRPGPAAEAQTPPPPQRALPLATEQNRAWLRVRTLLQAQVEAQNQVVEESGDTLSTATMLETRHVESSAPVTKTPGPIGGDSGLEFGIGRLRPVSVDASYAAAAAGAAATAAAGSAAGVASGALWSQQQHGDKSCTVPPKSSSNNVVAGTVAAEICSTSGTPAPSTGHPFAVNGVISDTGGDSVTNLGVSPLPISPLNHRTAQLQHDFLHFSDNLPGRITKSELTERDADGFERDSNVARTTTTTTPTRRRPSRILPLSPISQSPASILYEHVPSAATAASSPAPGTTAADCAESGVISVAEASTTADAQSNAASASYEAFAVQDGGVEDYSSMLQPPSSTLRFSALQGLDGQQGCCLTVPTPEPTAAALKQNGSQQILNCHLAGIGNPLRHFGSSEFPSFLTSSTVTSCCQSFGDAGLRPTDHCSGVSGNFCVEECSAGIDGSHSCFAGSLEGVMQLLQGSPLGSRSPNSHLFASFGNQTQAESLTNSHTGGDTPHGVDSGHVGAMAAEAGFESGPPVELDGSYGSDRGNQERYETPFPVNEYSRLELSNRDPTADTEDDNLLNHTRDAIPGKPADSDRNSSVENSCRFSAFSEHESKQENSLIEHKEHEADGISAPLKPAPESGTFSAASFGSPSPRSANAASVSGSPVQSHRSPPPMRLQRVFSVRDLDLPVPDTDFPKETDPAPFTNVVLTQEICVRFVWVHFLEKQRGNDGCIINTLARPPCRRQQSCSCPCHVSLSLDCSTGTKNFRSRGQLDDPTDDTTAEQEFRSHSFNEVINRRELSGSDLETSTQEWDALPSATSESDGPMAAERDATGAMGAGTTGSTQPWSTAWNASNEFALQSVMVWGQTDRLTARQAVSACRSRATSVMMAVPDGLDGTPGLTPLHDDVLQ